MVYTESFPLRVTEFKGSEDPLASKDFLLARIVHGYQNSTRDNTISSEDPLAGIFARTVLGY